MCASPLRFLRAGPPPPKVALLPDPVFFSRVVPITPGASPAEAAGQVELALEAMSPFPLTQLYYGWFWSAGTEQAFVFAAYRRRFTTDQMAEWEGAEVVLPSFAAVLGARVQPATTVILQSPTGLTAVHWETPAVPSRVISQPLDPEPTEEARGQAREELIRAIGGSKTVIDLQSPLAADPAKSDGELVFRQNDFESRLAARTASALDVRDKGDLAALRAARKRDVVLWRVAMAAAAVIIFLGLGELALMAGKSWQSMRQRIYLAQKPRVDRIENVHQLTHRIDELATKRLLPLEMVTQLVGENLERKPADIQFTNVQADTTRGLYTVVVQGRTNNPPQINAYEATLKALPIFEKVVANIDDLRSDRASFTLVATFKPDALKPTKGSLAAKP